MRRPLRNEKSRAGRPGFWLPALMLLIVAALAISLTPPSYAGGKAAGRAVLQPGLSVEVSGAEESQSPNVQAATEFSHTAYLPLLARNHSIYLDSGFGVQIYSTNTSLSNKLADMGAKWVRLPLRWDDIEPVNTTPEHYTWPAGFERELAYLRGKGVSFILTLTHNPSWAATYPGGPIDKVDIGELVEFMEAVVARYGAAPYDVKHWEFYNEPDNGDEYFASLGAVGYFGYQPQAYVDVLQAVYEPMKAVDPEAQIVFGGIAYDAWDDPWGGPFVKLFLDNVLARGGGDYFDVMNFHYYLAFSDNWAAYGIDILGKYNYLRSKLAAYGVYKPFVCTETSMWSDAAHDGSDELQSRYVPQVFARSMAAGFRFTIWFRLVDDNELGTHKWGLLDAFYQPKPAYWAYQTLARQLGGAAYVRTLSLTETDSADIEAYEFEPGQGLAWADGGTRIVLAWTNDEQQHPLLLRGDELVQVDKFGLETRVHDGDDGQTDGFIRLIVGPSPVYLRLAE